VFLLAVPAGQEFSFALSKRSPGVGEDLPKLARDWLNGGLAHLGGGAKTNAGYGTMRPIDEPAPDLPGSTLATFEATLELVTPAFLAGASQKEEDCDLRPATLRGVLRWWWRALYAGMLDVKTLRALEAAIWGDTNAGGAVRIDVTRGNHTNTVEFDKSRLLPASETHKKSEHGIKDSDPEKTTMGLWYLSYGMDEIIKVNEKKQRKQRYYLEPGSVWQVKVIARDAFYSFDRNEITAEKQRKNGKTIPAAAIKEQVVNVLHLLCTYGGIGSKSRKGFGSVEMISPRLDKKTSEIVDDAKHFLQKYNIDPSDKNKIIGQALGRKLKPVEVNFKWKDYWLVLDQVGFAYQAYAQGKKHNLEKRALGMPRKIGRPTTGNFNPTGGEFGKMYQEEKDENKKANLRFASPIHFHISKSDANGYTVRILAFPSEYLPTLQDSQKLLSDAVTWIYDDLKRRSGLDCPKIRKGSGSDQAGGRGRLAANAPRTWQRVQAVLVPDPKGKGRRFAEDEERGLRGHIENSNDVPDEKKVGDSVELIVTMESVDGKDIRFRWPTAADQQRPSHPQRHGPDSDGLRHKPGSKKKKRR
jgi:CRISPR-associated protein Cmr6